MGRLNLLPAAVVLDIGCGAGQTLLQLSGRVGPEGQVIGVDVSRLLLDVARHRTSLLPQVQLIHADAQILTLPDASAHAIFLRFGEMGFREPVAAFANLRRMLRPTGTLGFVCWRALADIELDQFPLAAADLQVPVDPTPFSFADPETIRRTLDAAGFSAITVAPHDEDVSSGDLDAMLEVLLNVGSLGRILRETPDLLATAAPRLRGALAPRGDPAAVKLRAAVWVVTASGQAVL